MKILRQIKAAVAGLLDLPATLYVNFRVFPFPVGRKLPVYASRSCRVKGLCRNCMEITGPIRRGMIAFGKENGTLLGNRGYAVNLVFKKGAKLHFSGEATFAKGSSLLVERQASLSFGDRFSCNTGSTLLAYKAITFGDDVVLGWNVLVRDGDGHFLRDGAGNVVNHAKSVKVGNHVWLCNDTSVLKGVKIPDGVVVACNSLVTKSLPQENCVYGGNPPRPLRTNVEWVRDGRNYK